MTARKRGRPVKYDAETAARICAEVAKGRTLRAVCRDEGMPPESTVREWALDDREGFAARYARARDLMFEALADEIFDIADDGRNDWIEREGGAVVNGEAINRSRLRVDTRKWVLSKLKPERYGDKVAVTGGGEGDAPVQHALRVEFVGGRKDT